MRGGGTIVHIDVFVAMCQSTIVCVCELSSILGKSLCKL